MLVDQGTHQVVDAEQKRLDAAAAVWISSRRHQQVTPHQLRQKLQSEAL